MPIIKSLAVFLLLTITSRLTIAEDEPLAKVTRPACVWLVTFTLVRQRVAGQTPALRLQRVHGPHEARRPRLHGAVLHHLAGSGRIELVASSILRVEDVTFLTLAFWSHCCVVECEDVADGTGTS